MAMNRARRTSNINNILTYDTLGNSTLIANLTVEGLTGAGFVKADAAGLLSVDTAAYTVVTGATNYLTKITAPNTLGQSLVYDNGTSVYINTAVGVPGYGHAFQVMANGAGGLVVSTTDVASAIGIVNSSSANKTWDISPYGNHLVINESGIATRMKFDAGGNITIGDITNTGHKLEVVGSFRTTGTNTLSALQGVGDRMVVANTNGVLTTQPIPTGSITGSGAAGQVNFWTGTNTVSGSNNLFWDNANGRLGIGTPSPAYKLDVSTDSRINGDLYLALNGVLRFGTSLGVSKSTALMFIYSGTSSGVAGGTIINYWNGSTYAAGLQLTNNANTILQAGGTYVDNGQRLQVYGDTLLRGSGATDSTTALTVQDSASVNLFRIRNGGTASMLVSSAQTAPVFQITQRTTNANGASYIRILRYGNLLDDASQHADILGYWDTANTSGFRFQHPLGTGGGVTFNFIPAINVVSSSVVTINQTFNPTSGAFTITQLLLSPTINQTGGANGITRGLYVNPTLTAAADWRSIEFSNNTGWGLYGAGTANNYLAGKLLLNTTSITNTELLTVGGNILLRPTAAAGTFVESSIKLFAASDSGSGVSLFTTDNSGYGVGLGISTRDGATVSEKFRIFRNGNLLLQNGGTFTDLGQRLQVIGDAFVRGTGNTNATNALAVQNSDSVNIFRVRNDATLSIGSFSENPLIYSSDFTGGVSASGASLTFNIQNGAGGSGRYIFTGAAKSSTVVSGNQTLVLFLQSFAPTSGGVTYNVLDVQPTINQTGGANGITRGVYVNPALTSATDFRAIETTAGNVLFGASGTGFFWDNTNSRLGIGTNAPISRLSVTNTVANEFIATLRASGSPNPSINIEDGDITLPNFSTAGFNPPITNNTIGFISCSSGSSGGLAFTGITNINGGNPLYFQGISGRNSGNTNAIVSFVAGKHNNATSVTSLAASEIPFEFVNWSSTIARFYGNGNLVLQNGGTFTDSGYRIDVQGTARFTGATLVENIVRISTATAYALRLTNNTIIAGHDGGGGSELNLDVSSAYLSGYGALQIRTLQSGNLTLATNNTNRLWVNGVSGNISIGTATDDGVNKLQVTGTIVAGSASSTTGSVILRGSYSAGYLTTLGTDGSSGGAMLSYGIESAQNSTAGAFVSSSGIAIPRSAYVQNGGHIWYTAPSGSPAIGTSVTVTKHMELYNSGNLVLGGGAETAGHRLQVQGSLLVGTTNLTHGSFGSINARIASGEIAYSATNGNGVFYISITGVQPTIQSTSIINFNAALKMSTGKGFYLSNSGILTPNTRVALLVTENNDVTGTRTPHVTIGETLQNNFAGTNILGFTTSWRSAFTINATTALNGQTIALGMIGSIFNQQLIAPTNNSFLAGVVISPTFNDNTFTGNTKVALGIGNSVGYSIYQNESTAINYLNGTTLIGTLTNDGINKLQVAGSIASSGIMRSDAARTAATNDVSIALLGSNITTYTAGFTMGAAGYGLNAIYAQHEQRFGGNATFDAGNLNGAGLMLNRLAPTAAGTITMNQQAGRIRTMSNLHLQTQIQGNNNITVTHMSGLHIYGHYRTTGTITLTVGDYYGILLADPNEFSTGPTITGTNWGFYQQGAAPINAFEGSMLVGTTTTDANNRLVVSGNTRVTGNTTSAQFRLSALNTAPATSTSAGTTGEIRIDADNIYVCTATNTWKRAAIATF